MCSSWGFMEESVYLLIQFVGRIEFLATTETEPEMQRMMYEHQGRVRGGERRVGRTGRLRRTQTHQ